MSNSNSTDPGIAAIATYLPEGVVSNDELVDRFDFDRAFLDDKVGVRERHIAAADEAVSDDLYEEAVRTILGSHRGSVSLLQRRLGIGYTRAGKLIDTMATDGIIGPYRGSKARDIRMTLEEWEAGRARRKSA